MIAIILTRKMIMKIKYTNENLKKQVKENMIAMKFLITMELIGAFLCFLSFYNAYKELPSEKSYMSILTNDHPVGLIFGITILFVNSLFMHWAGTLNVIRHLRPACGSVRYTPEEIDEQANRPESVWYSATGIYIAPDIIIGTQKGIAAVEYTDIKKAYIRSRCHTRRTPPYYVPRSRVRYEDYYKYQLVIKTNNHRKLIICNTTHFDESVGEVIKEKCGPGVWEDN